MGLNIVGHLWERVQVSKRYIGITKVKWVFEMLTYNPSSNPKSWDAV